MIEPTMMRRAFGSPDQPIREIVRMTIDLEREEVEPSPLWKLPKKQPPPRKKSRWVKPEMSEDAKKVMQNEAARFAETKKRKAEERKGK